MKLLKWTGAALALIVTIMVVKTLSFSHVEISLQPLLDNSEVDRDAVASRLAKGLTYKTISYMDAKDKNPEVFKEFHQFLKTSFPKMHETLELEMVNDLSLLYLWKGSDASLKPMLLMSHQDVVPVDSETLDRWTHEAFGGVISDGIIWGRGAVDIKSGVMGIMEAVEDLLGKGFEPKRGIYFAFGHDEEIGGKEGAAKIAELLKSRNVQLQMVLDEGGSIVGDGIIPGVDTPVALIGIAEKGYISLKLTAKAVGGHSSMPPKHTALGVIAKALVVLEETPFPVNMSYSEKLFENIGPAMGLAEKAVFANMWITQPLVETILSGSKTTNATIRTTTAVTMAKGSSKDNILPSEASAVVNFRIMPGESVESVTAFVKATIDNDDISITAVDGFGDEPSSISVSDNANFQLLKDSIYRVTQNADLIVTPYLVTGGTDAKHFTGLSDSIYRFAFNRFNPETLELMHGINEQISIDNYVDEVIFFRELMLGAQEF